MLSKIILPYVWNGMDGNERMGLKGMIHGLKTGIY